MNLEVGDGEGSRGDLGREMKLAGRKLESFYQRYCIRSHHSVYFRANGVNLAAKAIRVRIMT